MKQVYTLVLGTVLMSLYGFLPEARFTIRNLITYLLMYF